MSKPDCVGNDPKPYAIPHRPTNARDRRIDFLRGLAVLGISANHIWLEEAHRKNFDPYRFGNIFAFDFADVFILLSGIVAGLVFYPLFIQAGFRACQKKAFRRIRQIWGIQILCTLSALIIVLLCEHLFGLSVSLLYPFGDSFMKGIAGNLLLYNPSIFLDILPIYILLIATLPIALFIFRHSPLGYLALVFATWAIIWIPSLLDELGILSVPRQFFLNPYFIHPFAAQLLFFTGVAIGIKKQKIETFIRTPNNSLFFGAILFLLTTNYMAQVGWLVHFVNQKEFLGPLRVTELLAVLIIFCRLTGCFSFHRKGACTVEYCGRHILPVFAVTTVGAFMFSYLANGLGGGYVSYALCIVGNVCLCLLSGYVLERRRVGLEQAFTTDKSIAPEPLVLQPATG